MMILYQITEVPVQFWECASSTDKEIIKMGVSLTTTVISTDMYCCVYLPSRQGFIHRGHRYKVWKEHVCDHTNSLVSVEHIYIVCVCVYVCACACVFMSCVLRLWVQVEEVCLVTAGAVSSHGRLRSSSHSAV